MTTQGLDQWAQKVQGQASWHSQLTTALTQDKRHHQCGATIHLCVITHKRNKLLVQTLSQSLPTQGFAACSASLWDGWTITTLPASSPPTLARTSLLLLQQRTLQRPFGGPTLWCAAGLLYLTHVFASASSEL
jgi:hypothetical protein